MTSDKPINAFQDLPGIPSDQSPDILTTGHGDISTLFVSMAERHPEGADAEYLRWHSLDHRPEQQRLASLKASLRVVSTPACRAARAASDERFDAIDHVMLYFFADISGLEAFSHLSKALRDAGRSPFILNPVQRGVYAVEDKRVASRVTLGGDVLPWLPVKGVYLLVEQGSAPATELVEVPGVVGIWSCDALKTPFSTADAGQRFSCFFLDDDPVAVAERLRAVLEKRWQKSGIEPLLAASFQAIVPYEWDRYLP